MHVGSYLQTLCTFGVPVSAFLNLQPCVHQHSTGYIEPKTLHFEGVNYIENYSRMKTYAIRNANCELSVPFCGLFATMGTVQT